MRRPFLPLLLAAAAIAGCGDTVPADEFTPSPIPNAPIDVIPTSEPPQPMKVGEPRDTVPIATTIAAADCGADKLAGFVGQIAEPVTRTAVAGAAGHGNIRWLGADDTVGDELEPDRLNVLLDRQDRIIRYRCG